MRNRMREGVRTAEAIKPAADPVELPKTESVSAKTNKPGRPKTNKRPKPAKR